MSEETRGKKANEVVVDEVQEDEAVETTAEPTEAEAEVAEDVVEQRKQAIKEGLIGDAEETVDSEAERQRVENKRQSTQPSTPSTKDAFGRGGVAIAGPFARKRVRPREDVAKPAKPNNPRRGVQKIWEDRPINNVGDGTNTYDLPKKEKEEDE